MADNYEMDVEPETRWPRVRMNFDNGWTGSIIFRGSAMVAMIATVACWKTGRKGETTEVIENEARPDEAVRLLRDIAARARAL
jgi:hypothetical protein